MFFLKKFNPIIDSLCLPKLKLSKLVYFHFSSGIIIFLWFSFAIVFQIVTSKIMALVEMFLIEPTVMAKWLKSWPCLCWDPIWNLVHVPNAALAF